VIELLIVKRGKNGEQKAEMNGIKSQDISISCDALLHLIEILSVLKNGGENE